MKRASRRKKLRMRAGRLAVDGFFRGLSSAGRALPQSRPERHGVERIRDIPYRDTGAAHHLLDVYRPRDATGPLPVILYVHGGGFRILSKDSHWMMALAFARRGYLVVNINYRLAPEHRFPAALEDTCAALQWVAENAERYGGDLDRLAFAGESAGGNLVSSLTLATLYERPEPYARAVWDTGLTPRAVLPACGLLQVSDPQRFLRRRPLPVFVADRIVEVSRSYLPEDVLEHELADPLLVFERGEAPQRPLPPFFAPVGTADPILDDTRRLARALEAMGGTVEARYYPGEVHAFHAFVWRRNARRCWREMLAFTDRHVRDGAPASHCGRDDAPASHCGRDDAPYSHSIVAGGLDEMS